MLRIYTRCATLSHFEQHCATLGPRAGARREFTVIPPAGFSPAGGYSERRSAYPPAGVFANSPREETPRN